MVKAKEKSEESSARKSVRSPSQAVVTENQGSSELLELWKDAVVELIGREFASSEEAVDAIVSIAVQRTAKKGEPTADIEGFVREQLLNDPEIVASLRSILKFR